jgi:phosphoribosylaminoimidazole-succinocarboxamide synthase
MTSVKQLRVDRDPTARELGRGAFVFTDEYSIFDWGSMPDSIPDKGASLCTTGAFTFERLESAGVDTHYRGVVDQRDGVSPLDGVDDPPREMAIDLTVVPDLPHDGRNYDYDAYYAAVDRHYLVPLEIVFRNRVPVGSSLRRRSEPRVHGLDFDTWPDAPVELDAPIVEFSTKFEESDRYLSDREAETIAGPANLERLAAVARTVNTVISEQAQAAGLVHEDGKIECLYDEGTIRVADVAGTFDENRFSYDVRRVSKEVLRQYYKRTHGDWMDAVADAKAAAKRQDIADWRTLVEVEPPPAPSSVIEAVADLYRAGANAYTGQERFRAPGLESAVTAADML